MTSLQVSPDFSLYERENKIQGNLCNSPDQILLNSTCQYTGFLFLLATVSITEAHEIHGLVYEFHEPM